MADGGSVTLTAIPSKNYLFSGWYADDVQVSDSTNFRISNIHDNYDFVARFSQNYVTVDVDSNNWYAGDVIGGGTIPYKGSTTIAAKAHDGYVFIGWKEDGSFISREAYLNLDNVKNDLYYISKIQEDLNFIVKHMKDVDLEELATYELLQDSMLFRLITNQTMISFYPKKI